MRAEPISPPGVCPSAGDAFSGGAILVANRSACWAATKSEITGSPDGHVLPDAGVSRALLTTFSEPKTGLSPVKKNVGAGALKEEAQEVFGY